MFCARCGQQVPDLARFCSHCGTAAPVAAVPQPKKTSTRTPLIIVGAVVFFFIVILVLAVAVPALNGARMLARESAAMARLGILNQAEAEYRSQYGAFAVTLAQLGPPPASGSAGPSAAGFIPASLASGRVGGYVFAMTGTRFGYVISATPLVLKTTGRRSFYTDQTRVIRQSWAP